MKQTQIRVLLNVVGIGIALGLSAAQPWAFASGPGHADEDKPAGLQIRVRFDPAQSKTPLDGRVLVMLSKDSAEEPRLQISDSPKTQQIFGVDVEGWRPGDDAVVDASTLGYPVESLARFPPANIGFRRSCTSMKLFTVPTDTR